MSIHDSWDSLGPWQNSNQEFFTEEITFLSLSYGEVKVIYMKYMNYAIYEIYDIFYNPF